MNELQIKQLAFLNETIAHYSLKNRAEIYGKCVYSSIEEKSGGCAIGRHIIDKELCAKFDNHTKNKKVDSEEIFPLLPESLKELTSSFLMEVQGLHDDSLNWNLIGISERGMEHVKRIKTRFYLN